MGRKFKIHDSDKIYFVTFTVVEWIRAFDDETSAQIFLDSIRYCQKHKGLEVYAWVIMPNHAHLVIGRNKEPSLSEIIRDLKGFTSRQVKKELKNDQESLLYQIMMQTGIDNSRNKYFQFWQQHNHPIQLDSDYLFNQKVEYIHNNPVVANLATTPAEWKWSSAIDYDGGKGLLELTWS